MYTKTKGYKVFSVFNAIFLTVVALTCFLPLVHLFAVSLSGKAAVNSGAVSFWPVDLTGNAYTEIFRNGDFLHSIIVSLERTILGTAISMFLITTAGYALSKDFRGRSPLMWIFVFTMLFNGGLIPSYVLVSSLGLKDTIWALVLPGAFSAYNLILIVNFFRTIPKALEEAALIDGANFFTIFWKIYLPLSTAGLATVGLFIMVGNWNAWFDGILYMSQTHNYPLASFLQTVVIQNTTQNMALDPTAANQMSQNTIKAAQIFIGTLPIILVYPFLQKYFVKGIVMGAVKE
ncbi:MAG: carbohydrate ABC transporter permease [Sporolactobacillus sp.]|jgi:putative aldouronate transport system permease protein|nr:carbohydrate ABC transporter permease [Sporolactobacillus sp.]